MKRVLINILLFPILCVYAHAQDMSLCESYYADAEEAYKKQEYQLALNLYSLSEKNCPGFFEDCIEKIQACNKKINTASKGEEKKSPKTEPIKRSNISSDKKNLSFSQYGGNEKVKIFAKNSWYVSQSPDWVRASRDQNIIVVSCDTNYNQSAREEDIVLLDDSKEEFRITIFQDRNRDYLRLSATLINEADGHGYTYPIHVNCNTGWFVQQCPYWCKVETVKNDIKVTLEQNNTGGERNGKIVMVSRSNQKIKEEVSVTQGVFGHYLELSHGRFSDKTGEGCISKPFYVKTDCGRYRIENCPDWCEIVDRTSSSFCIRILENKGGGERNEHLKVIAGDLSEDLFVSQVARFFYINVNPSHVEATPGEEGYVQYKICHVETNCGPWAVVNAPDWCHVEEIDDKTFKIKIMPNEGGPRTAVFYVSTRECKCEMTVEQN